MAHFFHLPEPRNPQIPDPKLTQLKLLSANGEAAIGVWGIGGNWTIRAKNNPRFDANRFRLHGIIGHFMLRGLLTGDEIAAFDGGGAQQTAWSRVALSTGDKGASVIRQSQAFPAVRLDARGSRQGFWPMPEQEWLSWVERCLDVIKRNPVGSRVVASVSGAITIMPFLPNDKNADANCSTRVIRFTPKAFGGFEPGARPNEVLFHEFCHLADGCFSSYANSATPSFQFGGADFFTVTATNVYIALGAEKRPLRHDWGTGFKRLAAPYDAPGTGAPLYRQALLANFQTFATNQPTLNQSIRALGGPWNPF